MRAEPTESVIVAVSVTRHMVLCYFSRDLAGLDCQGPSCGVSFDWSILSHWTARLYIVLCSGETTEVLQNGFHSRGDRVLALARDIS